MTPEQRNYLLHTPWYQERYKRDEDLIADLSPSGKSSDEEHDVVETYAAEIARAERLAVAERIENCLLCRAIESAPKVLDALELVVADLRAELPDE